jgi:hypothetical protein
MYPAHLALEVTPWRVILCPLIPRSANGFENLVAAIQGDTNLAPRALEAPLVQYCLLRREARD